MAATVSTSFIVLSRAEWKSVGGQLLASGVLLKILAWGGTALCAVVLCFETWLILRWWRRKTSV